MKITKTSKGKKFLPNVKVNSLKEYFNLPKKQREKFGLYLYPWALPHVIDQEECEWDVFGKEIRKHYPIQGFIREWLLDVNNPVYWFGLKINQKIKDIYYTLKRYFSRNYLPRFRKQVTPLYYKDICDIIIEGNLALISDFWHEEIKNGYVDWESDAPHKDFYRWIQSAIFWIEVDRVKLLHELENLKNADKYNFIAKKIEINDEKILINMIKYRNMFWT